MAHINHQIPPEICHHFTVAHCYVHVIIAAEYNLIMLSELQKWVKCGLIIINPSMFVLLMSALTLKWNLFIENLCIL